MSNSTETTIKSVVASVVLLVATFAPDWSSTAQAAGAALSVILPAIYLVVRTAEHRQKTTLNAIREGNVPVSVHLN